MKPMPTEVLPADSVWTYKPDTDEWIIEKKSGNVVLSKKEVTTSLDITARLNQIKANILKEAVEKQDVVDFYLLSLLPPEYLKKTAIGPDHINGLALYQSIIEALRNEYIRRGMDELKDEAETTAWTKAIPADDMPDEIKQYYKYHEEPLEDRESDEEGEEHAERLPYTCEACGAGLYEDDVNSFDENIYCADCHDAAVEESIKENVLYCKTHHVFIVDAPRYLRDDLKDYLHGLPLADADEHEGPEHELIRHKQGLPIWKEVEENLKKQLKFRFQNKRRKPEAKELSLEKANPEDFKGIPKPKRESSLKKQAEWYEAPTSFEGLTSSDYYKLFKYAPWAHMYGGPAWAEIAKTINQMEHTIDWQKLALLIDHFHDLGHNTGKLLDKFPEWHEWFKDLLDLKASKDAVRQLMQLASPSVKQVVREYYSVERGGEDWRESHYPTTEFSHTDISTLLKDKHAPPVALFNAVKFVIENKGGASLGDLIRHPNFDSSKLLDVKKLLDQNREKVDSWRFSEFENFLQEKGLVPKKRFKVGDRVQHENGEFGTVTDIQENGNVAVKFDSYATSMWMYPNILEKAPQEETFKIGDAVIVKGNSTVATVDGIEPNGDVKIRYPSGAIHTHSPSDLARAPEKPEVPEEPLKVDDRVRIIGGGDNSTPGTVVGLLGDGGVKVKWDDVAYVYSYDPKDLERVASSKVHINKLSKKDKIAYEGGYPTEDDSVQFGIAPPGWMANEPWKKATESPKSISDLIEHYTETPHKEHGRIVDLDIKNRLLKFEDGFEVSFDDVSNLIPKESDAKMAPKPDRGSDDPEVNDYGQNFEWGPQDLGRVHQHSPAEYGWLPAGHEDEDGVSSNVMMSSFSSFMKKHSSLNNTGKVVKLDVSRFSKVYVNPTVEEGLNLLNAAVEHELRYIVDSSNNLFMWDSYYITHEQVKIEMGIDNEKEEGYIVSDGSIENLVKQRTARLNKSAITKNYALYIGDVKYPAVRTITRWKAEKVLRERFPEQYANGDYVILEEKFKTSSLNRQGSRQDVFAHGHHFTVLMNPTKSEAIGLMNQAKHHNVRWTVDEEGTLYLWDAFEAEHLHTINALEAIGYPINFDTNKYYGMAVSAEDLLSVLETWGRKIAANLVKKAHCGPCSAIKAEVLKMLADLKYKDNSVSDEMLCRLAELSADANNAPFSDYLLNDVIEKLPKQHEKEIQKLKNHVLALIDIQKRIDEKDPTESKIIPEKPLSKKEAFKPVKNVLIVCSGNTCRSPMAENILKQLRPDLNVVSRGLYAYGKGMEMSPGAQEALTEKGIPFGKHVSTEITEADVNAADLILVMENWQRNDLIKLFPQATTKTHLIGDVEIPDPAGLNSKDYAEVRDALTKALNRFASRGKKELQILAEEDAPCIKCGHKKKDHWWSGEPEAWCKECDNEGRKLCKQYIPKLEKEAFLKISKPQSGYVDNGKGYTCGRCAYFDAKNNSCALVQGEIKAQGCCNYWDDKTQLKQEGSGYTKEEAVYVEYPGVDYRCDECVFFDSKAKICTKVEGDISPTASCNLWQPIKKKEANLNNNAHVNDAYWLDPNGKAYLVRKEYTGASRTHWDWVWKNRQMLKTKYNINFDNPLQTDPIMVDMIKKGWVRIDHEPTEMTSITLADIRKIPSYVEDFIARFSVENQPILVEDINMKYAEVTPPFSSFQKAINDALRYPVKALSKKDINKVANPPSRFWIAPDGREFPVAGVHSSWLLNQGRDVLPEYEIIVENKSDIPSALEAMKEEGWVRISNEPAGSGFQIDVQNIQSIPPFIDDFISRYYKRGDKILIGDGYSQGVEITNPFPSIQKAVNKALKNSTIANKIEASVLDEVLSKEIQNEIAKRYGPQMLIALRFYNDAVRYGQPPDRAMRYALSEVKNMGKPLDEKNFIQVLKSYF